MRTIAIHTYNNQTIRKLMLLPFCEIHSTARSISFYHILTQQTATFSGSSFLTPVVVDTLARGATKQSLETLLNAWSTNGKRVLQQLLEEGYLG